MRVVLDTSVLVSAMLFGGTVGRIRDLWVDGRFVPLVSRDVLEEYVRVLSYPKFQLTEQEVRFLVRNEILRYAEPVGTTSVATMVVDDPDDDRFLVLAVDGSAQFLVSGDERLLGLRAFRGTRIVTARQFLAKFD